MATDSLQKSFKKLLTNNLKGAIIKAQRQRAELIKTEKEVDTMDTNTKMTNRIALTIAIEAIGDSNAEATAKLNKMIEQLDKKNAAPKQMTEKQKQNEVVKGEILAYLHDNEGVGYTVSDLLKTVPACEGDSNQHISALMRALVLDGSVVKYSEKRRTYFKVGE